MESMLRVGVVTQPHGLKGEVKVYPTTDSPQRFKEIKRVVIVTAEETTETEITSAGFFKNMAIVKFAGFDGYEAAESLRGSEIYVYRSDAQPLEEGEYYIADLLGCSCFDEEGVFIGKVRDVLQTGANDVYIVDTKESEAPYLRKKKELLLPVIAECVKKVDIEKGEIYVRVMPGLV